MNDGIDELQDVMQRASATPWGKTCSMLWAQAAHLAEQRDEPRLAVRCYGELCAAYMMGGESTRVIAPFMWLDTMFKEHPEYFEEDDVLALGWYYKYVVSTLRCVPTIPVAQCMSLLDEMRQYYVAHGDSMRAYHIRCYQFHRDMGQWEEADQAYMLWCTAEHSELADCERCDPSYEVAYYALRDQWDKAVAAGDKALAHDGEYCDSQPEALLTGMMEPWLRVGRDAEAWAAHIRAYRRYQQHPRYFEYMDEHLRYLALSGRAGRPERLERGLTILIRHMPWWTEAEHSRGLMDASVSACVLLESFSQDDSQRVLPVTLPGSGLVWAPRADVENPTIAQAAQWMRTLALDLAAQFDARPGHPAPGIEKERVLRRLSPKVAQMAPPQDGLVDVTGLGHYTSSIEFTSPLGASLPSSPPSLRDEATAASLGVHPTSEPAVSSGGGSALDPECDPGSSSPHEGTPASEDHPLVRLALTHEWTRMSPLSLLESGWSIVRGCSTVYKSELVRRLLADPSLVDTIDPTVPAELRAAWSSAVDSMSVTTEYPSRLLEEERHSDDPAYQLLISAHEHMEKRDLYQAATLADQAMRTPSAEPIGVRLEALALLGVAGKEAGYVDEAIESLRDVVNLSAVLGFDHIQVISMWYLARVLTNANRHVEAAEVCQNALDITERYPQWWSVRIRLVEVAAQANTRLGYHDAAAHYHQQAAELLHHNGHLDSAMAAYTAAARSYAQAMDFVHAIDMRALFLSLSRDFLAGKLLALELENPDDAAAYAHARSEAGVAYHALDTALHEYAMALVDQPGQVPASDIAVMDKLMDELRSVRTDPELDEYFAKDPQWRHAQWRLTYAYMQWNCYQYTAALAEQRAAVAEFAALGDTGLEAEACVGLAHMLHSNGDHTGAREEAQRVIDMLSAPRWASSPVKRSARKLLKELEEGGTEQ